MSTAPSRMRLMGATVEMPLAEMFWGERYGIVRDPFGHYWALCTRRELLAPMRLRHAFQPGRPKVVGPAADEDRSARPRPARGPLDSALHRLEE
jgi:glyoxalase/bleomycin resistance protein/dioxygenase superfamily protein